MNRRNFFQTLGVAALAMVVPGGLRNLWAAKPAGKDAPLPAGQHALDPTDPVAAAVGYKPNAKDIDLKKYPARGTPAAKNQFCSGCALYTSVNASWGKCSMLTNGLVSSRGWCGSWSKKS